MNNLTTKLVVSCKSTR